MAIELPIRPLHLDEFRGFAAMAERAFGKTFSDEAFAEYLEREGSVFEFDRSLAAFDGAEVVASSGLFTTDLRIPGGELAVPVVTWVSVARGYRRRGLLSRMLRGLMVGARERGEPMVSLFASEASIYGRHGFGIANQNRSLALERRASAFRADSPAPVPVRAVGLDGARAAFPPVYSAARAQHLGMPSRAARWWDYQVLADPPAYREGAGPKEFALAEGADGSVEGYAAWRLRSAWNGGLPDGTVEVTELVATTPEATAALWRWCLDVDLAERLVADRRPRDEPLAHLLADPRRLTGGTGDGLWLRFVDLPAALEARAWNGTDRLVLRVRDDLWPEQGGTWSLAVEQGSALCTRASAEADVELGTEALAALYLGETRAPALRAAGRLRECSTGAGRRLDLLLGVAEPAWTPEVF